MFGEEKLKWFLLFSGIDISGKWSKQSFYACARTRESDVAAAFCSHSVWCGVCSQGGWIVDARMAWKYTSAFWRLFKCFCKGFFIMRSWNLLNLITFSKVLHVLIIAIVNFLWLFWYIKHAEHLIISCGYD